MGAAARHFSWYGYASRAEYRRWLWAIIPIELAILLALASYGRNGTIPFPLSIAGVASFLLCLTYCLWLLFLTARRFRSAGCSRGWLIAAAIFRFNLPVGPHYWNVSVTIMLLAIFVGATVPDIPEE